MGNVRGVGLVAGVELVKDKATRAQFDPPGTVGAAFVARAQAHGLIVRNLVDTIALCPPLITTEAEIDEILRRFEVALKETAAAQNGGVASVIEFFNPPDAPAPGAFSRATRAAGLVFVSGTGAGNDIGGRRARVPPPSRRAGRSRTSPPSCARPAPRSTAWCR